MERVHVWKFTWGHGILSVILLFITGMMLMVYVASQQSNEIVEEHYYQQELAYQSRLDAARQLKALTSQSIVRQTQEHLMIHFPAGSYENLENGRIEFIRPDDMHQDARYDLNPPISGQFEVSKKDLHRGRYMIRITWTNQQIPYYFEENIFIDV